MSKITPNPAKMLLRDEIANRIAALSTEEKKRQSKIVYDKLINHPFYQRSKRVSLFMSTDGEIDTAPIIDHIRARGASAFVPQYAGGVMKMLRLETGDEQAMPKTRHGIQQHAKDQSRDDALESDDFPAVGTDLETVIKHFRARGASAFVPQYAGGVMKMLWLETGDEQAMPKTRHGIQQHAKDQSRDDALESGGLDLIIAPGVAFSRAGARLGHGGGYYDKFITGLRSNPATAPKVVAVAFDVQVVDNVPMDPQDQKVDDVIFAE